MRHVIDLTGQRFGMLTVIERAEKIGNHISWICKCDCGNVTKAITGNNLKKGHVKSCGCMYRKHGMHGSRLYSIWNGMKTRCYNKNHIHYNDYGGRGITVCEEWKDDFKAFADWAMSNGYADNLTIDRIDANGNYEPSNCEWKCMKEQSNNRRNNIIITYNGITKTIPQWADETGINYNTLRRRIERGWDIERAFTTK